MSSSSQPALPQAFHGIRDLALGAIQPLKPLDAKTEVNAEKLFSAKRTNAGRSLPPYYLVYFLLVELLGFKNRGQWEKTAWSVAVDFEGKGFMIEYRKMGLGVFAQDGDADEPLAERIVVAIKKGIKVAEPFFEWLARRAVEESRLNVNNNSDLLFSRFAFLKESYLATAAEAVAKKDDRVVRKTEHGKSYSFPAFQLTRNANWLALSAIEAFYSWTEHVFIHVAILQGALTTGEQVAKAAGAEWTEKFKLVLPLDNAETKRLYDQLITIRQQLRNFVAHGAFGKQGEAFSFHSNAGAVPVRLLESDGKRRYSMLGRADFNEGEALEAIERFIEYFWSGNRAPAKVYLQEAKLPLVLPFATDGTYQKAMQSVEEMKEFAGYLSEQWSRAADMDW